MVADTLALMPGTVVGTLATAGPEAGFGEFGRWLDLAGIFVFAISGAMLAVKKRFEVVGIVSLASVTALGGGIVRDVLLGDVPPVAFRDVWYLVVPLVASGLVFAGHTAVERRLHRPVLIFDAVGLGLFAATGALKAAAFDTTAIGAVLLAVLTATGGGVIRDVLANDPPQIFHPDSRLYAIPATLGAIVIVAISRNGGAAETVAPFVAAGVGALRLAALRWGWRAPMPRPTRASD